MPLTLTFDDAKVLEGLPALQEASVRLAAHRLTLVETVRGKTVTLQGGYRGTVVNVGSGKITLQDDKGVRREVGLTTARARQLLDATRPASARPARPARPATARPATARPAPARPATARPAPPPTTPRPKSPTRQPAATTRK